jgi:hypothetical protein
MIMPKAPYFGLYWLDACCSAQYINATFDTVASIWVIFILSWSTP